MGPAPLCDPNCNPLEECPAVYPSGYGCYFDDGAFTEPWGYSFSMELAADTEMLEEVCETDSTGWTGNLSDATRDEIAIPLDVLERYVGVYTGIYANSERTYNVYLDGEQLMAEIVGDYDAIGLGAAGLDAGVPRRLVPQTETLFDGLGLGYRFIVDESGAATALMVIHVTGDYRYDRQ